MSDEDELQELLGDGEYEGGLSVEEQRDRLRDRIQETFSLTEWPGDWSTLRDPFETFREKSWWFEVEVKNFKDEEVTGHLLHELGLGGS